MLAQTYLKTGHAAREKVIVNDDAVGLKSWPEVGEGFPEQLYGTAGNVFCPTQHNLRQNGENMK